ncbi:hypothetical protein LTR53_017318 [Teratosphaeriaceae sp. CCFEE 6253]|nr:hypothetical protein LTR53_017318 [Teratosphaeriaceae sp. CCFEE 6253]
MVTKHHSDAQYREALEGWSKHDIERVHIYHCLNYVLLHLDEGWRGLHLLVLVFLLRAGIRRLQTYLARARRPAALLLLLSGLNDPEFIAERRDGMLTLLSEAMPNDALALQQMTPVGMLQDRVKHIVRSSVVTVALCYDDGYWTRAIPQLARMGQQFDPQHSRTPALATALPTPAATMPGGCAEVDARQNRKRAYANIPGGDEASSPTKRRRMGLSDGASDRVDEHAKITEPAETDFPATAESDGTDCSRFRYYGALASTTKANVGDSQPSQENNDTYSDSSVSAGSVRAVRSPYLPSRVLTGNVTPSSHFQLREVPTPQPKTGSPTVIELGKREPSKKFAADTATSTSGPIGRDWGFEGKWIHLLGTARADRRHGLQGLRWLILHLTDW